MYSKYYFEFKQEANFTKINIAITNAHRSSKIFMSAEDTSDNAYFLSYDESNPSSSFYIQIQKALSSSAFGIIDDEIIYGAMTHTVVSKKTFFLKYDLSDDSYTSKALYTEENYYAMDSVGHSIYDSNSGTLIFAIVLSTPETFLLSQTDSNLESSKSLKTLTTPCWHIRSMMSSSLPTAIYFSLECTQWYICQYSLDTDTLTTFDIIDNEYNVYALAYEIGNSRIFAVGTLSDTQLQAVLVKIPIEDLVDNGFTSFSANSVAFLDVNSSEYYLQDSTIE